MFVQRDHRRITQIHDTTNRLDDTDVTKKSKRSERTNSPAFEIWLLQYRSRLAKLLRSKTD